MSIICVFLSLPVDSIRLRRQPGVHLEPAVQGSCPEAGGAHGHGAMHGVPSHGEHHRFCSTREWQDHQTLEVRHVGPSNPLRSCRPIQSGTSFVIQSIPPTWNLVECDRRQLLRNVATLLTYWTDQIIKSTSNESAPRAWLPLLRDITDAWYSMMRLRNLY